MRDRPRLLLRAQELFCERFVWQWVVDSPLTGLVFAHIPKGEARGLPGHTRKYLYSAFTVTRTERTVFHNTPNWIRWFRKVAIKHAKACQSTL